MRIFPETLDFQETKSYFPVHVFKIVWLKTHTHNTHPRAHAHTRAFTLFLELGLGRFLPPFQLLVAGRAQSRCPRSGRAGTVSAVSAAGEAGAGGRVAPAPACSLQAGPPASVPERQGHGQCVFLSFLMKFASGDGPLVYTPQGDVVNKVQDWRIIRAQ